VARVGDRVTRTGRRAGLKRYDRAYFDRWYRSPCHRVSADAEVRRRAALVVAVTEALLSRPVRSVLDVGCGEGRWRATLRRLRPGLRYVGVDPSAYVVARFGRRRNIRRGRFGELGDLRLPGPFDIVIVDDVLHYLEAAELRSGLRAVTRVLGGVAYLGAYAAGDDIAGDLQGLRRRSKQWYRRAFADAGLTPCGLHCSVGRALRRELDALQQLA